MMLGNCKSKWYITTHLLEWPKSKTLIVPNLERRWSSGTPFSAGRWGGRGEVECNVATSEDSLAVSYKTKQTLTIWSCNHAPWYLPKVFENLGSHESLHMGIYSSFIYIYKTWKQPRCPSVGELVNKPWYVQTTVYYSALKRNELTSHEKTWKNLKRILLSERSQSEKASMIHVNYVRFWNRQNYADNKKISGRQS